MSRIPMKSAAVLLVLGVIAVAVARAEWTDGGVPACLAEGHQAYVALASAGAGSAIAAWRDYRTNVHEQVFAQRVDGTGDELWRSNGVLASADSLVDARPAIASDGGGGAIVVWDDYRNGGSDIYAQSIGPSGALRWSAGGIAVCAAGSDQMEGIVAPDGSGGAIVAWLDYRFGGSSDIYAQRISPVGYPRWTATGAPVCAAQDNQSFMRMISTGDGGAIFAWEDTRNPGTRVVYVQRLDGSGNPLWTVNGVAASDAAALQYNPTLAPDGSGGAIVAWEEWPDDLHGSIHAQRIDASGARAWGTTGVLVWENTGAMTYWWFPSAVSDGAGGAILVWDYWDGLSSDQAIYSQRLSGAGSKVWSTGGVLTSSTASSGNFEPAVVADGSGGAIVAWEDSRASMELDIYAQRLTAAGSLAWAAGGVPVCTVAGYQTGPAIVPDGLGGAVIAWTDYRGGSDADIYAARVFPDGAVTGVDAQPPAGPVLEQNYPNPFNPSTRIAFVLSKPGRVSVSIHDVSGRLVRVLSEGERPAGRHEIVWDGTDEAGREVASGLYLCRMSASGTVNVKKLVLLK